MWRKLITFLRSHASLVEERDRALHMAVESNNARLEMAAQLVGLRVDNIGLQARLDAREVELRERERKIARLREHRTQLIALQPRGVLQ